jgi:hypothetical protein
MNEKAKKNNTYSFVTLTSRSRFSHSSFLIWGFGGYTRYLFLSDNYGIGKQREKRTIEEKNSRVLFGI